MAKLKRYTDFADLKLPATYNQKSGIVDSKKIKELEKNFELLRSNVLAKKNQL